MKILLYGRLADVLGSAIELPVDRACSIAELRKRVAANWPDAAELLENRRVRACVGDSIVSEDAVVAPGTQVEFWPPVSGG